MNTRKLLLCLVVLSTARAEYKPNPYQIQPIQPIQGIQPLQPIQYVQPIQQWQVGITAQPAPAIPSAAAIWTVAPTPVTPPVRSIFSTGTDLRSTLTTRQQPTPAGTNGVQQTNILSKHPPESNLGVLNGNPYDPNSLANPYGAGSPYKSGGLLNPYSTNGSPYSNSSATSPYATQPPTLVDSKGNYHGELSANPYRPDSTSNPYGRYGSPYSPDSVNNPFGAGNPFSTESIYVLPKKK